MNKKNFLTLLLILVILGLLGIATYRIYITPNDDPNSDAQKLLGQNEDGIFTDMLGNTVSFDDYSGKVRVVTSWASWCPQCEEELQDLNTLASAYAKREVSVIAINRKESIEQAQRFLNSLPELSSLKIVIDQEDIFYSTNDGYAMPETIIYDARGNIVTHKRGVLTYSELEEALELALKASE